MPVPSTATPKVKVTLVFSGALFAPKLRRQAAKDSAEGKGTIMNYPKGNFYRQSRLTLDGVALTGYHPQSKNDSIGVKENQLVRCRFRQVFAPQFRQSSLSLPIKGRKRGLTFMDYYPLIDSPIHFLLYNPNMGRSKDLSGFLSSLILERPD